MDRWNKSRIRAGILCLTMILSFIFWEDIPVTNASEKDGVQVATGSAIGVVTGSAITFLPEGNTTTVTGSSITIKPSDIIEGTEEEDTEEPNEDEIIEEDVKDEIIEEEEIEDLQPESEEVLNEVVESSYTVSIPKTMSLSGVSSVAGARTWNLNRVSYTVTVKATVATGSAIHVIPADSFVFSQEGKSDRVASVYQEQTVFESSNGISVGELEAGVTVDGVIILPNMTAGVWEGYLTFDISCTGKTEKEDSESEETAVEESVIEENEPLMDEGKGDGT